MSIKAAGKEYKVLLPHQIRLAPHSLVFQAFIAHLGRVNLWATMALAWSISSMAGRERVLGDVSVGAGITFTDRE
jgi:hypothetical protein